MNKDCLIFIFKMFNSQDTSHGLHGNNLNISDPIESATDL